MVPRPDQLAKAEEHIERLDCWLTRNKWRSYDPYDYKEFSAYRALIRRQIAGSDRWSQWLKNAIDGCTVISPRLFRRLLGLKPIETSHGDALLALGYCRLFQLFGKPDYYSKARVAIERLQDKRLQKYRSSCWGFPFDWESWRHFPANVPIAPITYWCGWSFLEYSEISNQPEYFKTAASAARSFQTVFGFKSHPSGSLSVNFTDRDNFEVINAACSASSLMMMVGQKIDDRGMVTSARKLAQFVLENLGVDGSWTYFAQRYLEAPPCIDSPHTGMVLDGLLNLVVHEPEPFWRDKYVAALEKGLAYYLGHLFRTDGYPFLEIGKLHPADIHSCGQALITLSRVVRLGNSYLSRAILGSAWIGCCSVLDWTIQHMCMRDGSFMYRRYGPIPVQLATIRLGQGLMLQGLAEWLSAAKLN